MDLAQRKTMTQVPGTELPKQEGTYITNFGSLKFDAERNSFLMNGHDKPTLTIVDWWLEPNA